MNKLLCFVCASLLLCSCRGKASSSASETGTLVIATNSWTAAYAQAAGAKNIVTLATFDMAHPSEYELRPGDIQKLADAKIILYAGYEVMAERLKKGLNLPPEKLLAIETEYNFESIEKAVMKIAVKLGTESIARENIQEIRRVLDEGRKVMDEKRLTGQPAIVHRFQTPIARELGFAPVMIFGTVSPEASDIITASKTSASFILDNIHSPMGQPFKAVLPHARYVQWLNFPGQKGTQTLTDVIRYNISQL